MNNVIAIPRVERREPIEVSSLIGVKYFSRLRTTIFPFCFDKAKQ